MAFKKTNYDFRFFFKINKCDKMICEMSDKLRASLKEVRNSYENTGK